MAKKPTDVTFDLERIEELMHDLLNAEEAIRRGVKVPASISNPVKVVARLTSLAKAASGAAGAIAFCMEMQTDITELAQQMRERL
jgi:NurA-like 5'-3' nuclease